jgi:metal-responsive CopG/Arc/MetJ family transcriptional regulator
MAKTKIAITLAEGTVKYLDDLVKKQVFTNRSQAIQQAVDEKIERLGRSRLAQECAKLDPESEKELAEEGLGEDLPEWPEY